jgi:hypothetical protein
MKIPTIIMFPVSGTVRMKRKEAQPVQTRAHIRSIHLGFPRGVSIDEQPQKSSPGMCPACVQACASEVVWIFFVQFFELSLAID